jgi:hypothetical protein
LELHGEIDRLVDKRPAVLADELGCSGIVDVDHLDAARARHIEIAPGDERLHRAVELVVRIEDRVLVQEVVLRIAVEEAGHVDDDEALLQIGDVDIIIERMIGCSSFTGLCLRFGSSSSVLGSATDVAQASARRCAGRAAKPAN